MVRAAVVLAVIALLAGTFAAGRSEAASFWLEEGDRVDGDVLSVVGGAVTIRRSIGGLQILRLDDIERVDLKTAEGTISGQLAGYEDGRIEIVDSDGTTFMVAADGSVVDRSDPSPTAAAPAEVALDSETAAIEDDPAPIGPAQTKKSAVKLFEVIDDQIVMAMSNGSTIVGRVTSTTRKTLTIKPVSGGLRPVIRSHVENVALRSNDGTEIRGSFLDWSDGAYALVLSDGTLAVGLTPDGPRDEANLDAFVSTLLVGGAGGPALATAAAEEAQPNETVKPDARSEPLRQSASLEAQPSEAPPAGGDLVTVEILPSADIITEGAGAVEIDFQVDREDDQPISIFYTTLIGTATSDLDYETKQGRISLGGGTTSARIDIPLIDDDVREEREHFIIFFSTDSDHAALSTKRMRIEVEDDD